MGGTRARATAGLVLDAGALIPLLQRALAPGRAFRVPAGVVAQAWRHGRVQVTLAKFLRCGEVEIVPLDDQLTRSCGELCAAANSPDTIDASVVIAARERRDAIVTSDPRNLRRLDQSEPMIPV